MTPPHPNRSCIRNIDSTSPPISGATGGEFSAADACYDFADFQQLLAFRERQAEGRSRNIVERQHWYSMIEIPPPPLHYREPIFIGNLRLASRFNLAPLAGYTNLPFRLSIRELGAAGLCTTDLVNARAILENIKKTMDLLATVAGERPLAVQIFGSKPGEMAAAARWLVDRHLADSIDINMGCPVRKVVKTGGGSSLMCDTTGTTVELVRQVVEAVPVPVTVKM